MVVTCAHAITKPPPVQEFIIRLLRSVRAFVILQVSHDFKRDCQIVCRRVEWGQQNQL